MSVIESWCDGEGVHRYIVDLKIETDVNPDESDVHAHTSRDAKEKEAFHSDEASDADDDDDAVSQTSTELYEEEPFETYQDRVKKLVLLKWPQLSEGDVEIERMAGGSCNRIVGFSIRDATQDYKTTKYILRVPCRWGQRALIDDLAPLLYLSTHTKIPIPQLETYDESKQNPIEDFYMIQYRAPGKPILYNYLEMRHGTRCAVARQLGKFYHQLLTVQEKRIGTIGALRSEFESAWTFEVQNLKPDLARVRIDDCLRESVGQDVVTTMYNVLKYRHEEAVENEIYLDELESAAWMAMLEDLRGMGCLEDVPFTLCHLDLEPRNILADPSNEESPISAFLDWDSAIFAPAILACKPPMWLWAWSEDDEEDERQANDVPSTAENRELKQIFEQAAGPIYQRLAYGTVNRLARKLVWFTLYGTHSSEQGREAEEMVNEWAQFKQSSSGEKVDNAT